MFKRLLQVFYWLAFAFAGLMTAFAVAVFVAYLRTGPAEPSYMAGDRLMFSVLSAIAAGISYGVGRAARYVGFGH